MSKINWDNFYNCEDLEIMNSMFVENVMGVLESECPLKRFQSRKKFRNWVDTDVKDMMAMRDQLKDQARASGRMEDWDSFRLMRNGVVKRLRSCKSEYFNKLYVNAEKEKTTKTLFNLTKELQGNKTGNMPQTLLKDGRPIRKPVEMANFQLDYYVNKLR